MGNWAITWDRVETPLWRVAVTLLRPLHLALAFPSVLYVAAMTVFLFRPPDLFSLYADRMAFVVVVFFVALRALALRDEIPFFPALSVPMLGLVSLAVFRAMREPFDPQLWSIIASKFIVPFVMFHIAVLVFRGRNEQRHFEIFTVVVLGYLVFISIAFLVDATSLIWPRFILDESIGFHADRARGPFLQAVANGVSLNILGILALVLPRSYRKLVWLLWILLPLAVVATMTRAVWISFGMSALAMCYLLVERRVQAMCLIMVVAGLLGGLALGLIIRLRKVFGTARRNAGRWRRGWPSTAGRGRCFKNVHGRDGPRERCMPSWGGVWRAIICAFFMCTTRTWHCLSNSVCPGWPSTGSCFSICLDSGVRVRKNLHP